MVEFSPPRLYTSPADLEAMRQVLQAGALAHTDSYYIHTGDLSWWLFYPPIGHDLFQHTFLWDDPAQPGNCLGWMMVDPTWPSFEVFLQPGLLGTPLAAAMYQWAETIAIERSTMAASNPMHKLWVAEKDAFQRAHLESRGFTSASWDTTFSVDLGQTIPTTKLPLGYTLRACRGLAEVQARAAAQYEAFGGTAPMDKYLERFSRFMGTPAYAGALDIVAAAPEGRIGAFCIAWLDAVTLTGHFEPVGTHPDFQRQGLGKAVLLYALRQLFVRGMRAATVCTPEHNTPAVALYLSVGFKPVKRLGLYEKTV